MSKENGGPAFPEIRIRSGDNYNPPTKLYYGGMSLRDYFAAKALAGMLADSEVKATREDFAERSYALADAMILERAK